MYTYIYICICTSTYKDTSIYITEDRVQGDLAPLRHNNMRRGVDISSDARKSFHLFV